MKQIDLPLYKFYLIEGMTQEDLNELALERNNLSEEVYRLNNIIKKAIEYMEETIDFSWENDSPIKVGKSLSLNKLLNILKGEDKE